MRPQTPLSLSLAPLFSLSLSTGDIADSVRVRDWKSGGERHVTLARVISPDMNYGRDHKHPLSMRHSR